MIAVLSRLVDHLTVLYLRLLRLVNGPRRHIRCRPLGRSGGSDQVAQLHAAALRTRVEQLNTPSLRTAYRAGHGRRSQFRFYFPSPWKSGIPENDVARGSGWCHAEPGRMPCIVILHGWMMSHFRGLHSIGESFYRVGLDVYFLELPYHMHRKPPGAFSGECFYGPHGEHRFDGTVQSVLDVCALIRWLRARGTPTVGLYGVSLGGLITLLACCYSEEIDFAIANSPACCLEELSRRSLMSRGLLPERARVSSKAPAISLRAVDPIYLRPLVPAERIALVVPENDLIVPAELPRRLAEQWHGVRVLTYPHGHITVNLSRKMKQDVVRLVRDFLGEELNPVETEDRQETEGGLRQ